MAKLTGSLKIIAIAGSFDSSAVKERAGLDWWNVQRGDVLVVRCLSSLRARRADIFSRDGKVAMNGQW